MRAILPILLLLSACASVARKPSSDELQWHGQGGVEIAEAAGGLTVVRADPRVAPLELVNAPESAGSVSDVAARGHYVLVTNAAMFAQDYVTSIGYMRSFDRVNNAHVSAKLKGWLLIHPKKSGLPPVKVGSEAAAAGYDVAFQTYRMWTAEDGILWNKGASIFRQVALVGTDAGGHVLFFYHPGFADVHDLVAQILDLGLGVNGLLYLDGGHHGALYLAPALGRGFNTGIELPNVLGVRAAN